MSKSPVRVGSCPPLPSLMVTFGAAAAMVTASWAGWDKRAPRYRGRYFFPGEGTDGGRGSTASNLEGPLVRTSAVTTTCMLCSGKVQGPPLEDQPPPL